MRTFIFGCKGQLGRELLTRFQREGFVAGADLPDIDITDAAAVQRVLDAFRADLVINAAAYTDVERAEDEVGKAFAVNETGAGVVARVADGLGLPVIYYSTDYVFDGAKAAPYEPEDAVCPMSVYARSKAGGERAVVAANRRHLIIRTAWLYGPGGNNFVEKILCAAAARPELKVVRDEIGSPTCTRDLAEATAALALTGAAGIFHAVNAGGCSRYEFAAEIVRAAGYATPVLPVPSSEFPTKARRPSYSVLSNAKLEAATGLRMPHWREALGDYILGRKQ
jgi:dTDP-4-dehydrorhamnose reductase